MKKTKGLVMRTSPKVTGIFTEKGDFIEIPTPKEPPVVGQTIEVNINARRLFVFNNSALKYASVCSSFVPCSKHECLLLIYSEYGSRFGCSRYQ